ncbi:YqhR family membrane protein [Jeotgalibacillus salarius]|nr:YqhR family membrane protein [Jeotgalibacillus salarius]
MEFPTIKRIPLAIYTSIAGGLLFYCLYRFYVYFHFIERELLKPKFSFMTAEWQKGFVSESLFALLILICSIIWAMVYYIIFKNRDSIYPGVFSGLFLLGVLLLLGWFLEWRINPAELQVRTIISLNSLFILYGLFTGYSISYPDPYTNHHTEK